MSGINNSQVFFGCNPNPFKSFWVLFKNQIIMVNRSVVGLILVIVILMALASWPFFLDFPNIQYLIFLPVALFVLFILDFLVYLFLLRFSPAFHVRELEFTESGFWVTNKNSERLFISYQNIDSIHYRFYPYASMFSSLMRSSLAMPWAFSRHFLIKFRQENDTRSELRIPLNITCVYQALDIIIKHLPEEKRGNVRVMNGKVTASLAKKTWFIDLETPSGKLILVVLAIIVLAFWICIILFLTD